jgi:hypothetical protein
MRNVIQRQIGDWKRWTTRIEKWTCKNFSDHYNATPSLEANDCRKRSVEVGLDYFLIVFAGYSLL